MARRGAGKKELAVGDRVIVQHRMPLPENRSDRTVEMEGTILYIHPAGRFAVIELAFAGGLWSGPARIRETHALSALQRAADAQSERKDT